AVEHEIKSSYRTALKIRAARQRILPLNEALEAASKDVERISEQIGGPPQQIQPNTTQISALSHISELK
ncbi:MAG: hypothetical protein EZS28_026169, partial [Streblomastix strix]